MLKIPFYSNKKDNNHCVQACLKSVLKFYFPKKNYSFSYLDRVTSHVENGMWTWDYAMLLFLAKNGFNVQYIADFNLQSFAKEGESYLKKIWSDEVYQIQKKHSNFKAEQKFAKQVLKQKLFIIKQRSATLYDIRLLFKKDYILIIPINPYVLDGEVGYASHTVIVTDITKNQIIFHDPGLPSRENRVTSLSIFLKAMCYPDRNSASLIGIKLDL